MKREIKFRAWKQNQKAMFYPKETIHPIDLPQVMLEKENDILMQFTGLKDKNGKEIYEGDIKRWKFNNRVRYSECYWSDIDCGFRWRLLKHNEKQEFYDLPFKYDNEEDFYNYIIESNQRELGFDSFSEIIGNIYENPELLKY